MSTIKRYTKTFGRGFIEGFSSLFGLYMEEPKISKSGFYDDHKALKKDWENVGNDMKKAIRQFEKEHNEKDGIPV